MALSKARKAIFHGKYGDELFELLLQAENIIVTEDNVEKSLADVLVEITSSALTQADVDARIGTLVGTLPVGSQAANIVAHFTAEIAGVNTQLTTLIGSDTGKSVRTIAGEVVAATDHLHRRKVNSVSDIDPTAADADKYIYMVPKAESETGDAYDEYMVIDGAVEKVGDWKVDLSDYAQKDPNANTGNLLKAKNDGSYEDAGIAAADVATKQEVGAKADKVTGATAGDLAALDVNGNLTDSGKKVSDFVEKEQGKGLSTNDYSDTEKQKVADAYSVKHTHANAAVLDGINAEKVAAWDSKAKVYVSATQPANLQNGDIWLQTFSE